MSVNRGQRRAEFVGDRADEISLLGCEHSLLVERAAQNFGLVRETLARVEKLDRIAAEHGKRLREFAYLIAPGLKRNCKIRVMRRQPPHERPERKKRTRHTQPHIEAQADEKKKDRDDEIRDPGMSIRDCLCCAISRHRSLRASQLHQTLSSASAASKLERALLSKSEKAASGFPSCASAATRRASSTCSDQWREN